MATRASAASRPDMDIAQVVALQTVHRLMARDDRTPAGQGDVRQGRLTRRKTSRQELAGVDAESLEQRQLQTPITQRLAAKWWPC